MQATIVALYGDKPDTLTAFLSDCQNIVGEFLGSNFKKYDIGQVHGTLVGLERDEDAPWRFYNRNFRTLRNVEAPMDFDGLLTFLREGGHFPLQLQIGGFQDRDYPFTSRDMTPFNRSFSLQGENVVIMGWPLRGLPLSDKPSSPPTIIRESLLYPMTLDSIRRGAQRYGVLHAYHAKPKDTDNDFFFRIGMITSPDSVSTKLKKRIQETMREYIAGMPPLVINIDLSDVYIVFYTSEKLLLGSSTQYSIDGRNLDKDFIRHFFDKNSQINSA